MQKEVKYAIEQKVCGFKSQNNEKRLKRKEAC